MFGVKSITRYLKQATVMLDISSKNETLNLCKIMACNDKPLSKCNVLKYYMERSNDFDDKQLNESDCQDRNSKDVNSAKEISFHQISTINHSQFHKSHLPDIGEVEKNVLFQENTNREQNKKVEPPTKTNAPNNVLQCIEEISAVSRCLSNIKVGTNKIRDRKYLDMAYSNKTQENMVGHGKSTKENRENEVELQTVHKSPQNRHNDKNAVQNEKYDLTELKNQNSKNKIDPSSSESLKQYSYNFDNTKMHLIANVDSSLKKPTKERETFISNEENYVNSNSSENEKLRIENKIRNANKMLGSGVSNTDEQPGSSDSTKEHYGNERLIIENKIKNANKMLGFRTLCSYNKSIFSIPTNECRDHTKQNHVYNRMNSRFSSIFKSKQRHISHEYCRKAFLHQNAKHITHKRKKICHYNRRYSSARYFNVMLINKRYKSDKIYVNQFNMNNNDNQPYSYRLYKRRPVYINYDKSKNIIGKFFQKQKTHDHKPKRVRTKHGTEVASENTSNPFKNLPIERLVCAVNSRICNNKPNQTDNIIKDHEIEVPQETSYSKKLDNTKTYTSSFSETQKALETSNKKLFQTSNDNITIPNTLFQTNLENKLKSDSPSKEIIQNNINCINEDINNIFIKFYEQLKANKHLNNTNSKTLLNYIPIDRLFCEYERRIQHEESIFKERTTTNKDISKAKNSDLRSEEVHVKNKIIANASLTECTEQTERSDEEKSKMTDELKGPFVTKLLECNHNNLCTNPPTWLDEEEKQSFKNYFKTAYGDNSLEYTIYKSKNKSNTITNELNDIDNEIERSKVYQIKLKTKINGNERGATNQIPSTRECQDDLKLNNLKSENPSSASENCGKKLCNNLDKFDSNTTRKMDNNTASVTNTSVKTHKCNDEIPQKLQKIKSIQSTLGKLDTLAETNSKVNQLDTDENNTTVILTGNCFVKKFNKLNSNKLVNEKFKKRETQALTTSKILGVNGSSSCETTKISENECCKISKDDYQKDLKLHLDKNKNNSTLRHTDGDEVIGNKRNLDINSLANETPEGNSTIINTLPNNRKHEGIVVGNNKIRNDFYFNKKHNAYTNTGIMKSNKIFGTHKLNTNIQDAGSKTKNANTKDINDDKVEMCIKENDNALKQLNTFKYYNKNYLNILKVLNECSLRYQSDQHFEIVNQNVDSITKQEELDIRHATIELEIAAKDLIDDIPVLLNLLAALDKHKSCLITYELVCLNELYEAIIKMSTFNESGKFNGIQLLNRSTPNKIDSDSLTNCVVSSVSRNVDILHFLELINSLEFISTNVRLKLTEEILSDNIENKNAICCKDIR